MRLRKNIARATAFTLVGALGVAGIFAVNNNSLEDSTAVSGSWANFVSTAWMNESDARYKDYKVTPGSSENSPYLIQTAEEFSGIRAFEGGDALAGKYLLLTSDIDLSTHYWDPIEVYGYGDPIEDIENGNYDNILNLPYSGNVVNIDGNSKIISGMNIQNTYDRVVTNDGHEDTYYYQHAGATGLFSYTYKANISNIRLENPIIALSETSGVPAEEDDYYYREIGVNDVMGSVVGVAQNSHISGVHVSGLKLDYMASFGDYINDECPPNLLSTEDVSGCGNYFAPRQIIAGGAVGTSFGETLVSETSVKYGTVSVKPVVDETISGWTMDSVSYGFVSMGGLVGTNIHSTILSTCSSADVVFSDNGYKLYERNIPDSDSLNEPTVSDTEFPDGRILPSADMYFGGLVGFTDSPEISYDDCIYNSCSHSEMNIDAGIARYTMVGGVVGYVWQDKIMNNYFDGSINTQNDNVVGEIIGVVDLYDEYDDTSIMANHYMSRGVSPIGYSWSDSDHDYSDGFTAITTVEKLTADLSTGRSLVIQNVMSDSNLSQAQATLMTTEWSVQDGTFPLSCTDARTAGLVFPDNRVDVPNTGAK